MSLKLYVYEKCATCQKARQFLDKRNVRYHSVAIVENPPPLAELERMLGFIKAAGGSFKNLFNTSGQVYRELKISEQLKGGLSEPEALKLLAKNGKLIKRPFALGDDFGLVGFKAEQWKVWK